VAWEQIIEGQAEYAQGRLLLTNESTRSSQARRRTGQDSGVNDAHHLCAICNPQDWRAKTLISGRHKAFYMMEGLVEFEGYSLSAIMARLALAGHHLATYTLMSLVGRAFNGELVGE